MKDKYLYRVMEEYMRRRSLTVWLPLHAAAQYTVQAEELFLTKSKKTLQWYWYHMIPYKEIQQWNEKELSQNLKLKHIFQS